MSKIHYVNDLLNLIATNNDLYILDVETHNDYVHLQIKSTEEQIRRYIQRKERNKTVQAFIVVEVSALLQNKA